MGFSWQSSRYFIKSQKRWTLVVEWKCKGVFVSNLRSKNLNRSKHTMEWSDQNVMDVVMVVYIIQNTPCADGRPGGKEASASSISIQLLIYYHLKSFTHLHPRLLSPVAAFLIYGEKLKTWPAVFKHQHGCGFNLELLIRLPNKVNWTYIIDSKSLNLISLPRWCCIAFNRQQEIPVSLHYLWSQTVKYY